MSWLHLLLEGPRCALFGHHGMNVWVFGHHEWRCAHCCYRVQVDLEKP